MYEQRNFLHQRNCLHQRNRDATATRASSFIRAELTPPKPEDADSVDHLVRIRPEEIQVQEP
jgi:hypothetical protein